MARGGLMAERLAAGTDQDGFARQVGAIAEAKVGAR